MIILWFAFKKIKIFAEATSKSSEWYDQWQEGSNHLVYWYSEAENKDGKHWRYVEGVPTIW